MTAIYPINVNYLILVLAIRTDPYMTAPAGIAVNIEYLHFVCYVIFIAYYIRFRKMSLYLNKRYAFLALFLFHATSIIPAPTLAMDDPDPSLTLHSRPSAVLHSVSLDCAFDFFHKGEFIKAVEVFSELIRKSGATITCAYLNHIYQHKLAPVPEDLLENIEHIPTFLKKPGKEFLKISLIYRNYNLAKTNKAQETHLRELDAMRRQGYGFALVLLQDILDKSTGARIRFINNLFKATGQPCSLKFETCFTPDAIKLLFKKVEVNPVFKKALQCFVVNYNKVKSTSNNPYFIADLAMQIYELSPENYKDQTGIPFPKNTLYPERDYWAELAFQNGSIKAYLPCAEYYLINSKPTYNKFLTVNYFISRFKKNTVDNEEADNTRLKTIIQKYKRIADTTNAVAQGPYGILCYDSGDWDEASKYFLMAADRGNAKAQYNYACMLRKHSGQENDVKAREYFKKAADQGEIEAQFSYAKMLTEKGNEPENLQEARKYSKIAADQGNMHAQLLFGYLVNEENPQQALLYYKMAADQGHTNALENYITFSHKLLHTKNSEEKIKKAAEKGSPLMKCNYGLFCYQKGNFKEAFELYKTAADQDYVLGYHRMGIMHYEGKGVAQDFIKAYEYFQKAADKGQLDSHYYLGIIFYYGRGVPQNYTKAYTMFKTAADQGDAVAQNCCARMLLQEKGIPQDSAKAYQYFYKAANQGHLDSILFLYSIENRKKNLKESFDSQARPIEETLLEKDDVLEIPIPFHTSLESLVPPPKDEENGVMSFIEELTEEELKLQEEISQFNQQNEQVWALNQQQKKLQKEAKKEAAARTVCTLIITKKDFDEVLESEKLQLEKQQEKKKSEVKEETMMLVESIFGVKGAQKIKSFTDQEAAQAFVNLGCIVNSAHGENSTLLSFNLGGGRMIKMKYHNPHGHGDHKLYNAMKPHFKKFLTLINKTPEMLEGQRQVNFAISRRCDKRGEKLRVNKL